MNTSEKIDLISPAMIRVQKEIKVAIKDSDNPFFHSKYADFVTVVNACREALLNNDISVLQGGNLWVASTSSPIWELTTRLQHISGQWIESNYPITAKDMNDPQKVGSSFTYAKRYSLAAMVGVITDDDDDGNKAAEKSSPLDTVDYTKATEVDYNPNYVISFGKKYKGKKLSELTDSEIISFRSYLLESEKKEKKPLNITAVEFINQSFAYLALPIEDIKQ